MPFERFVLLVNHTFDNKNIYKWMNECITNIMIYANFLDCIKILNAFNDFLCSTDIFDYFFCLFKNDFCHLNLFVKKLVKTMIWRLHLLLDDFNDFHCKTNFFLFCFLKNYFYHLNLFKKTNVHLKLHYTNEWCQ
jgi:hypothetical protein